MRMTKKEKTPWLPRKGRKVPVTDPITGRKIGIPERTGFAVMMILAGLLVVVAFVLYFGHG
jgi:hypothetical protein